MPANPKNTGPTGFGELLRSFREHAPSDQNRRVTQQQLAERIGRDPTTLSRWETEERLPTQEDIEKLAQALGLSQWQQDRLRETAGYPVADVATLHSQLTDVSKVVREIHHLLVPPSAVPPGNEGSSQGVPETAVDQLPTLPPSPYRGLSAFREEDAPFFFGREEFTYRLRVMVGQHSLVAVLGSSGSGKSSVVQAGLVPQLRQEGHWQITSFRPGIRPLHALAAALLTLLEPQQSETERLIEASRLEEALLQGELGLAEIAERILQKEPQARRLLLVVDQFEELYTLCPDSLVQQSFLDLLLTRVRAQGRLEPTLTLVLTLRADFLGEALAYRPFSDALQDATLNLGPMTREELAQAIVAPAAQLGVVFEPGLIERILNDIGAEPGNLPLLEFSLTQLWDGQQKGELSHQVYEAIGFVAGALACYAEEVYNRLNDAERTRVRGVFLQLVRPGEGWADTRRLATHAELGERNWQLVQWLADARLVVTDRTPDGQEVAELVHEALITSWDRLGQWVDADRTFRSWQERLRMAIQQWEISGRRDEGTLLRGGLLAEAERWLGDRGGELAEPERHYILTSIKMQEQERIASEWMRRKIISGLAIGLGLALILALLAGWQWREAETQRQVAEVQRREAETQRQVAEGGQPGPPSP